MFPNWVILTRVVCRARLNLQTCLNWEQRLLVSAWVSAWNKKSFCLSKASDGIWNQTIPPSEGDAIEIDDDISNLPFEDHLAARISRKTNPIFHRLKRSFAREEQCFSFGKRPGKRYLESHQPGFSGTPTTRTAASWFQIWKRRIVERTTFFRSETLPFLFGVV